MTNAERQAKANRKRKASGLGKAQGWVHSHQVADIQMIMRMLRENPGLELGPLRDTRTGKLVKWR